MNTKTLDFLMRTYTRCESILDVDDTLSQLETDVIVEIIGSLSRLPEFESSRADESS